MFWKKKVQSSAAMTGSAEPLRQAPKSKQKELEVAAKELAVRLKKDPIPGWRNQVKRMRSKGNPHLALANYGDFMKYTAELRHDLAESCGAAEAEIERLIDENRARRRDHESRSSDL